jgi:hypothetical protein
MPAALIRIDQATNASPIGVAGRSRDDIDISQVVQLRNADDSGVRSWRWDIVDRPAGSAAALSSPVSAAPTFTPDVAGSYLIELVVNEGRTGEIDRRIVAIRDALNLRVPAAGEKNEANWLIGGTPNARGYQPEFEALYAAVADVDAAVDATDATVEGLASEIVYDVDFTALPNNTITDGSEVIDGLTWTASNIASRTTLAAVVNGSGIRITHVNGSSSALAGADTAPRLAIPLATLIPGYHPFHRYLFLVEFSWAVTPDAAGERFSIGLYGAAASPWPSCSLRYIGASANYGASAAAVVIEAERDNTISNGQSPTSPVFGFSLDGPTTISTWKAAALPSTIGATLLPIVNNRATNATAAGDFNTFSHPTANLFVMALGATGTAAVHSVLIESLRIFRI